MDYANLIGAAIRAIGAVVLIAGEQTGNEGAKQAGAALATIGDATAGVTGDRRGLERRTGMDRRSTDSVGRRASDTFDPLAP